MRIALMSDIHGNLVALEAALADIAREQVDEIICLGDVAEFGPQPLEVLARLRALSWPVVMGNTDERLLHPGRPSDLQDTRADDIERWVIRLLGEADRAFIATFQPTVERWLGDLRLLCCHGSPRSNREGIGTETPEDVLVEITDSLGATVIACGHTHRQFLRRVGPTVVLNIGSVGLPIEDVPAGTPRNPAWAEYAIVSAAHGRLSIDLRRAPVELAALRRVVLTSEMPHREWWAKDWHEGGQRSA